MRSFHTGPDGFLFRRSEQSSLAIFVIVACRCFYYLVLFVIQIKSLFKAVIENNFCSRRPPALLEDWKTWFADAVRSREFYNLAF